MSALRHKQLHDRTPTESAPLSPAEPAARASSLVIRNVHISGRRTSVRLEPEMWHALYEIAGLERCSIHDLCSAVDRERPPGGSFSAALRVYLMQYYRTAYKTRPLDYKVAIALAAVKALKSGPRRVIRPHGGISEDSA